MCEILQILECEMCTENLATRIKESQKNTLFLNLPGRGYLGHHLSFSSVSITTRGAKERMMHTMRTHTHTLVTHTNT